MAKSTLNVAYDTLTAGPFLTILCPARYVVTLKYPEVFPLLQKAINEETRKTMEFADSTQCMKENAPILEEVIKLRHRTHPSSFSLMNTAF